MTNVPIQRPFFLLLSIACPALPAAAEVRLRPGFVPHKAVAVRSASARAVDTVSASTGNAAQAGRVRELLAGYGPLLEILPLAALLRASFLDGELELEFDFGGKQRRKVELAAKQLWVLEKNGSTRRRTSKSRTLRVNRQLRFRIGSQGIESVHSGDLEVKWGLFYFDLNMSTERTDERAVLNDGRVVLETELDGSPRKRAGEVVPSLASRWVVLEAQGRRVEIPIEDARTLVAPAELVAVTSAPASIASRVGRHCLNSIARLWSPGRETVVSRLARASATSGWSGRRDWIARSLEPSMGGLE